jgi:hypothetical protein
MATGYEVRQGGVGYVRIPFRLGMKRVPLCSLQHEKEARSNLGGARGARLERKALGTMKARAAGLQARNLPISSKRIGTDRAEANPNRDRRLRSWLG